MKTTLIAAQIEVYVFVCARCGVEATGRPHSARQVEPGFFVAQDQALPAGWRCFPLASDMPDGDGRRGPDPSKLTWAQNFCVGCSAHMLDTIAAALRGDT